MRRFLVLGCALMAGALGVSRAQITAEISDGIEKTSLPVSMAGELSAQAGFSMSAVKNQPYSLWETTTLVKTLSDGTKITSVRRDHKMRDTEGRERDEQGILKDGELKILTILLRDPVGRIMASLFPFTKTVIITHVLEPKPLTEEQRTIAAKRLAKAGAYGKAHPLQSANEDLPGQMIAGVYAEGKRNTAVYPVGRMGNDREFQRVYETWESPELKIVVRRVSDDPIVGKITLDVSELQRTDPGPSLFQIPADYKVVDLKKDSVE